MDGDQVLLLYLGLDGVIDGVGAEVDRAPDERRGGLRPAALDVQDLDVEPLLCEVALRLGKRGRQIHHEGDPADADGDLLGRPARGRGAGDEHGEQDHHRHDATQNYVHDFLPELASSSPHLGTAFQYENRASRRLRATSMAMTAAIRTSSPA